MRRLPNNASVHQVISQFATISQSTGEGSLPEPAATFVRALSLTNFEFLGFVPLGCVTSGMTFYDQVVVKAMTPVAAVGLLSCPTLHSKLRGQPNDDAWRTVKRLAMLLLELSLPGITTSLIQVFLCSSFDNGTFLRAESTLVCDGSSQRKLAVTLACIGIVVYTIGGEFRSIQPNAVKTRLIRTHL